MGGANDCATTEFGFDHGLKPVAAEGALLLDIGTDFIELVDADGFGKQGAIGGAALDRIIGQGGVGGVRLNECVVGAERIAAVA